MSFDWDRFCGLPIIGIMRGLPSERVQDAAEAAVRGGIRTLEITLNSPGAYEHIGALREHFGPRVNIGAGTVCDMGQYEKAVAAGASFIVTPILDEAVVQAGKAAGVPVICGAYTPTEIYRAHSLGAPMVKVFPSDQLGPPYIKAVLGPLNRIKLCPTGGVTVENLPAFRAAGASGFGVGGQLFNVTRISDGELDWVESRARAFRDAYIYS